MRMTEQTPLAGWGNYPVHSCTVYEPDRYEQIAELLSGRTALAYIARGEGRSYGDNALNEAGGVIVTRAFRKMLRFSPEDGLLECEAGVTFADISNVFLHRGYFLPVTPGTKFITVGGAIANDVHGKNHHRDGSFSEHLVSIRLLTADGRIRECSREQNAELFWATIGGIGLTGVIVSAAFRLLPVESAYMTIDVYKARDLEETVARFAETDEQYQYSVAWVDCLATGRRLGRSVVMQGNHTARSSLPQGTAPFPPVRQSALQVPFFLPQAALHPRNVQLFNEVYYGRQRTKTNKIIRLEPYFYPLDAIGEWNRMYGKRGFIQYQFVLPHQTSHAGMKEIVALLSESRNSSFLAVLKCFGKASDGWLSFPTPGMTLALDLPYTKQLIPFLHRIDRTVLKYGGRIYLAKDSIMLPETFAAMYPALDRFKQLCAEVDPHGVLASSMSRRLGITERGGMS